VAAQIERARDQEIVATYLMSKATLAADYPSDADIQSAYDKNRDRFLVPRQYHLAQIFIDVPADADDKVQAEKKKKAEDIARQAKAAGADFEDLARRYSEHKTSAAQGGDLGWSAEQQVVPEIRVQVSGMSKGDISDPIRSSTGWHVICLLDTKAAGIRPLAEVKDTIVASLRQQKLEENEDAYVESLLQKTPPAINEIGVEALFKSTP